MTDKFTTAKRVVLGLLSAIGFVLLSFMFWPTSDNWQRIDDTIGTVKNLALRQSKYGNAVTTVIEFEDGTSVKMRISSDFDVRAGDRVLLSTFVDEDKPSKRKYMFVRKLPKEESVFP